MDDRNENWHGESDSYREGSKIYPGGRRGASNGSRFWQMLAVACLILLVIFASIIVYLLVGRSSNATSNGTKPNKLQSIVGSTPTTIPVQPSATPTSVPPTPTSPLTIGTVMCQADAAHGWNGWNGTSDWKMLNSVFLDDGTNTNGSITAPCQLSVADYAVETTIQVVNSHPCCVNNFGIMVRNSSAGGYAFGVEIDSNHFAKITTDYSSLDSLGTAHFDPGISTHTYRAEVKGNTLKLFIDGGLLVSATDNQFLDAGQVGLYSSFVQIEVTSFKVVAL